MTEVAYLARGDDDRGDDQAGGASEHDTALITFLNDFFAAEREPKPKPEAKTLPRRNHPAPVQYQPQEPAPEPEPAAVPPSAPLPNWPLLPALPAAVEVTPPPATLAPSGWPPAGGGPGWTPPPGPPAEPAGESGTASRPRFSLRRRGR